MSKGDPFGFPPDLEKMPEDVARKVIEVAAAQQAHLERMDQHEVVLATRGQLIALGTAVFFGLIALVVTLNGHDWVGGGIAGTTIFGLSMAFVAGQPSKR